MRREEIVDIFQELVCSSLGPPQIAWINSPRWAVRVESEGCHLHTTNPCSLFDRSVRILGSIYVYSTDSILPRSSMWPRFSVLYPRYGSLWLHVIACIPFSNLVELHTRIQIHFPRGICVCQLRLAISTLLKDIWRTPMTNYDYLLFIYNNNWIWGDGPDTDMINSSLGSLILRNKCPKSIDRTPACRV